MPTQKINHLAVILAAIVFFLWGGLWYSVLFSRQWTALMGLSSPPTAGSTPYIIAFLMALVLAYGTAIALARGEERSAGHGASFGLFMGVFFVASLMLTGNVFDGHPVTLWLINAGYAVIGMAIVGAIVGGWKARA